MILLKNGTVLDGRGKRREKCDVLVDHGKIKEIGAGLTTPPKCQVIDCSGMIVTPGFIDAHCHVGMWEESNEWAGSDGNEMTNPSTPHLRAIDAINPDDIAFKDACKAGITAVFTGPGSANVIGGQSVVIKTAGSSVVDERVVKDPAGLKMALGENPKRVYGVGKNQYPSTRMGNAAVMREAFYKAKNYLEKKKRGKKDPDKAPEFDLQNEVLASVLEGKLTARCHAHRFDDIITIIRIQKEFGFKLRIEHCTDGHKIAPYLAKNKIDAIIGPSMSARVKEELKDITFSTAGILEKAGVKVAIMTDAPVIPIDYLPLMVGLARKNGLSEEGALKSVTLHAAEICDCADRIGSLEPGKDADIAVFDGDPFEMKSVCRLTLIDGKIVHNILS
ncbi:MAG TPA: amidohydrolase [Candidatus Mcinerneyibacteriales bacterium]|nr:amidohydrolase [Candidatus Mcinerneyibacteriales bacterium]